MNEYEDTVMNHHKLSVSYTAVLIGLALTGCANAPKGQQALTIKPAYTIEHGGAVDVSYGYIVRAREAETDGQLEQASIWWARAVGAAPGRADTHHGLGLCLARMGRLKEGVASLREATKLAPQDARILNNLGHALKLQGDRDEAIALFREALQADPEHAQARFNLAVLEHPDLSMAVANLPSPAPAPAPAPSHKAAPAYTVALGVQQQPNTPAMAQISTGGDGTQVTQTDNIKTVPLSSVALNDRAAPVSGMSITLTGLTVEVFNGNGVAGAAKGLSQTLAKHGVQASRIANMTRYDTVNTRVLYRPGKATEARQLARLLPSHSELVEATPAQVQAMRADVRVVLGHNVNRVATDGPAIEVAMMDTHRM